MNYEEIIEVTYLGKTIFVLEFFDHGNRPNTGIWYYKDGKTKIETSASCRPYIIEGINWGIA